MKKLFFQFSFALLALGCMAAEQPCLIVESIDSEQDAYALEQMQRIDFADGQLTVVTTDNATQSYAIADTRRIVFGTTTPTGGVEIPADEASAETLRVVPNPAESVVTVYGLTADVAVAVMDLAGKVLLKSQLSAENPTLGVASLPEGSYLLLVGKRALRLIKK